MKISTHAVMLLILAVLLAGAACAPGRTPLNPEPPAPGASHQDTAAVVVTGLVRSSGGPALAGVQIQVWRGSPDGRSLLAATAQTAADGTFSIRTRPDDVLFFERRDYFSMLWLTPDDASPGQTFDLTIKLQRHLTVSASAPLTTVLTSDDATHTERTSWSFAEGPYACGPCKQIIVASAPSNAILRLTWTGDVPLSLWAGDTWNAPTRYAPRSGAREIAILVSEVPTPNGLNMLLVGVDPASDTAGLPVTFTVAIEPR